MIKNCLQCRRPEFDPLEKGKRHLPLDRGAWRATVHGVAKSCTAEQLTPLER